MLYQNRTFTCPTTGKKITDLEYNLRVGNITQEEYDKLVAEKEECSQS